MEITPRFTSCFNRTIHQLDRRGFIRDWLISEAWIARADDLDQVLASTGNPFGKDGRWVLTNGPDIAELKAKLFQKRKFVIEQSLPTVIESGKISWKAPGVGQVDTGIWRRLHTGDDGYVDWSHFSYTPEYRHSLMATQIEVDQPEWRKLKFESPGPIQVWLNGQIILSSDKFGYMQPVVNEVETLLPSGISELIISQWQISLREVRHVVRVSVIGLPVRIVIPSNGADEYASEIAERALEQISIKQWARDNDEIEILGPIGLKIRVKKVRDLGQGVSVTLKKGSGKISVTQLQKAAADALANESGSLDGDVTATMLDTGEIFLEIKVDSADTPVSRVFRTARVPERVRTKVTKLEPQVWRDEVLSHVSDSYPSSARALARRELNPKYVVTREDLKSALSMINSKADCADFEAVGLINVLHRFNQANWEIGLRDEVIKSLVDFKYWIDQPGLDAMCYFTENHQLVWHTAEHLIGDFLKDEKFSNSGFQGSEHSTHGQEMAQAWLIRKLEGGFSEFDSNAYLAIDTLALISLMEFSPSKKIRQFSEALLDRMLLSLASNSWRGIHGAAHGRSYTTTFRSSRFEETAPIMWALWGMGSLNLAVLPVTTLITAKRYELPSLIRKVAHSLDKTWSGRQVYRGKYRFTSDLLDRPYNSDLRVYRTADGMLSSVQDYRSGLPGLQEHVWGATLGTEVQVFTSYPAAYSHATSVRPNAWAGHLVLPRVRQIENVVLAIYPIKDDLYPDFTHLWFPTPFMNEYVIKGSWIAGRVGDGFIAVSTPGGVSPRLNGDTAYQEWIPNQDGSLYVALFSDKKSSKSFKAFVSSLKEPKYDEKNLHISFKHKKNFELGWLNNLEVNGSHSEIIDGLPERPPRLENPAVTLSGDDEILRANFKGERLEIDLIKGTRLYPESKA